MFVLFTLIVVFILKIIRQCQNFRCWLMNFKNLRSLRPCVIMCFDRTPYLFCHSIWIRWNSEVLIIFNKCKQFLFKKFLSFYLSFHCIIPVYLMLIYNCSFFTFFVLFFYCFKFVKELRRSLFLLLKLSIKVLFFPHIYNYYNNEQN